MACKYTYGNQVYDSLDDLKIAVKNDLQRSADKEEVVDNNNQSNTAVKPQGTINVYWGQAESSTSTKILSNLAPRKFKYKSSDGISREYGSVEHAYQTLKSGSFDQVTYDKYIRAGGYGTKITGKIANKATNLQLMKDLVVASFEQNSDSPAAKKLLQYEKFTHNTNEIIDQAFLEGLKLAQAKLLSSQQSNTTQQSSVPYYTGSITPEPNTIFVFGSNPEGRHGLGAAKVAKEQFGAKYGQGEGLQGNAYALPTKDLRITENNGFKSITPEQITANIKRLYEAARQNPSKQFKIAYNEPAGKRSLNGYTGFEMIEMFNNAGERPANIIFSKHWVDTGKLNLQQSKTEAKITDVEVEAMTDALVEMYPEIEFGVENNPNFVDKEGVFNQRIENTNQNVDAEVLDKINSFELYEDKETLCPGGICNFTARKSTEHLIEVGLNPYPNTYNGSQLPVQVDSPMGPFKITHFVSAVAINDSVYIYDMPQNEFISDDFFGMGSDVKVKQAYKPRLIFLSLDDIQSNYNLSVEDAGNFIHSILNNRGWEGANAAPSFKEYISKNINNSEIYIKSLEDEISKSGYKMPEYFNREAYEKEVQDKRNNIINETLSKEDKDKVLNYYANKLRIKTREYLPTKTDSFSLRELVKSVIGDIEVNIDKSSFQNALASLKEFLNSKDFIDRLLHAYEFSGTNLKNAESSISDVYSTGRLMAGFINQVKSYGIAREQGCIARA